MSLPRKEEGGHHTFLRNEPNFLGRLVRYNSLHTTGLRRRSIRKSFGFVFQNEPNLGVFFEGTQGELDLFLGKTGRPAVCPRQFERAGRPFYGEVRNGFGASWSICQMDGEFVPPRDRGGRQFDAQEFFGGVEEVAGFGGRQGGVVGELLERGTIGGDSSD